MSTISISLFNAIGLPKQAISPALKIAQTSSIHLITEFWPLSPNSYPTSWIHFYAYGQLIHSFNNRGSFGIVLLINPSNPSPIQHIPHNEPLLAKYTLSFIFFKTPCILSLLTSFSIPYRHVGHSLITPFKFSNTTSTIIYGDLNARMVMYTGDNFLTRRGRIF